MVTMMRRRGRRRAAQRPPALGAVAQEYAAMSWPVCPGAHPRRGLDGMPEPGRACSCDRVGCPAPGAHPVSGLPPPAFLPLLEWFLASTDSRRHELLNHQRK